MGKSLFAKFTRRGVGGRTATPASSPGIAAAPRAQRLRSPRWSDLRLWLGVGLLIVSMFVGARLLSQGSDTIAVWQAERDLSVGSREWELRPATVSLGAATSDYVPVTEQPTGMLRVPVAAGDLLPRSALGEPIDGPRRTVTVGVDPLHAPVGLAPGDVVDVWSTPAADSMIGAEGESLEPRLVLANVSVEHVASDSLGVGGQMAVVLTVAPEQVPEVVRAGRIGAVDLVRVPVDSQAVEAPLDVVAQEPQ